VTTTPVDTDPPLQDIAQRQMQAAWSSKPKIDIQLRLHAPKVAIPITRSAGAEQVTLLADLGSLVISSNHTEAGTLSPEEASIYECYTLLSSDLSVHLINGEFSWPRGDEAPFVDNQSPAVANTPRTGWRNIAEQSPASGSAQRITDNQGGGAKAIPLLDQCSTGASVHMAYVSHPTLPLARIGLQVSLLPVYLLRVRAV
jgi:hypothetical protein